MTVLGQQLTSEGARNLLIAIGGIVSGTTSTVATFIFHHESGILFVCGISSYSLAMYASVKHIQSLKKKK